MLSRSEVMVGDWIFYEGAIFGPNVDNPKNVRVYPCMLMDRSDDTPPLMRYHPIMLTEKILILNGFTKENPFGSYYKRFYDKDITIYPSFDRIEIVVVDGRGTDGEEVWCGSEIERRKKFSVHELQQLFRLHDMAKLANEFKVGEYKEKKYANELSRNEEVGGPE